MLWPGQAAVYISVVHIIKSNRTPIQKLLNGVPVSDISSGLDTLSISETPTKLKNNENKSFSGSKLDGIGFVIDNEEADLLITKDSRNAQVIFPYLNGIDLNTSPDQSGTKSVINFFDWGEEKAKKYTDVYKIVRDRVYPARQFHSEEKARINWWQYQRIRPELYKSINGFTQVLVVAQTSATLAFVFVPNGQVFASGTIVFAFENYEYFSVLQSAFHESWVKRFSSTLKTDVRYTPTDCFQTFPFPNVTEMTKLRGMGEKCHVHRRQVMFCRKEGLTAIYNRYHDPQEKATDIAQLRELHVELDNAVAAAYGWQDLDLGHGFHETAQGVRYTISEPARREVLSRLLKLNHERYEEEVKAGLQDKKTTKGAKGAKSAKKARRVKDKKGQYELF